ncbi:hypothetical protein WSM22_21480 [Cytophagales bacterium WSM2-2]|nr:hypothetical protein WSM22_21480 [Cytophagales bacterium WSM2-2]
MGISLQAYSSRDFRIALFIFFLCYGTGASAQKLLQRIDAIGVTGGTGVIALIGSSIYDGGSGTLPVQNFGVDLRFSLKENSRLKLNTKIMMERLGLKTERSLVNWNESTLNLETGLKTATMNLDYITVPLSAQYYFTKKMNWYLSAGLFGGAFVKGRLTVETSFISMTSKITYDEAYSIKKYNMGGTLGIGYQANIGASYLLFLELNSRLGFMNISNQDPSLPTSTQARTSALSFSISFCRKLHK